MSEWKDFLEHLDNLGQSSATAQPGPVMINFVNRYLEPLDSIKYRVQYDGKVLNGTTTKDCHTVEIQPLSMGSIEVFAWSRMRGEFKLIDQINPLLGKRLLINERAKTFKHQSKTEPHPANQTGANPKPPTTSAPPPQHKTKGAPPEENQGVDPVKAKNARDEPEHRTKRQPADQIRVLQLKKIFPAAEETYLAKVADELNTDLAKYKLDTVLRRAHFFAQVRQEAGAALSPKEENLNYRPTVLIAKFAYYADHPDEAIADGQLVENENNKPKRKVKKKTIVRAANQPAVANRAYGGKGGNGGAESGDGWRFRGRGIFQLTLRGNYKDFNKDYPNYWADGAVDFLSDPDKLCEFPYFIRSAVWYWVQRSVYTKADGGSANCDVDAVTKRVNGPAMDAAAARRKNFHELCYPAFK
jgi:putative chitinase